jgi:hypothetical protein
MHRSGTSCLTGIVQNLGVELGEVYTQNPYNQKGNCEHPRIMALNDSLLEYNQGAWDEPVDACRWTAEHLRERDAIAALLKKNANSYWGFKDPRTLLTFDFWLPVLDSPHFIGTFRHPLRVAMSLQQRDQFSLDKSFALWLEYNRRLLKKSLLYGFPLVDFDLDAESYLADVLHKICALGLSTERFPQAKNFFAAHLRHQTGIDTGSQPLPPDVMSLYQQLAGGARSVSYINAAKKLEYYPALEAISDD